MPFEERMVENSLLKERRSLINSGIERRFIKICGNSIYVKNKLHGIVQDRQFHLAININNESVNLTHEDTPKQNAPDVESMQTTASSQNNSQ